MKNGCVIGVDYFDEDHPNEYCQREYGQSRDQGDIDKKKRWWKRWYEMEGEAHATSD